MDKKILLDDVSIDIDNKNLLKEKEQKKKLLKEKEQNVLEVNDINVIGNNNKILIDGQEVTLDKLL